MQIDNTTEMHLDDLKSYAYQWFEEKYSALCKLLDGVEEARADVKPDAQLAVN